MKKEFAIFGVAILGMIVIVTLFVSHVNFQREAIGVMSVSAAQSIGLLPKQEGSNPFGPKRIWFAKHKDGEFEYRAVWPVIGSVPFDIFGSGITTRDLVIECKQLGQHACNLGTLNERQNSNHSDN